MTLRACVFVLLSATLLAQEPPPFALASESRRCRAERHVRSPLQSNKEPQNWLTYSGGLSSQRHSLLTTITPANARDLELKWVFQSRSLDAASGHPAGRRRHDVHDSEPERRDRVERRHGQADLDLLLRPIRLPRTAAAGCLAAWRFRATRFFSRPSMRGSSPSMPRPDASCGRPSRPAIRSKATRSPWRRSS